MAKKHNTRNIKSLQKHLNKEKHLEQHKTHITLTTVTYKNNKHIMNNQHTV